MNKVYSNDIVRGILNCIQKLDSDRCIISIDGRAASGKTSFANWLAKELACDVIHMDDFFLPKELRTKSRICEPGGNIHYERFIKEVVTHLKDEKSFKYGVFDCSCMDIVRYNKITKFKYLIIEGAYALHPMFSKYYSISIFMDVDRDIQKKRINTRNNNEKFVMFINNWIPMEEKYINEFSIDKNNNFILKLEFAGEVNES